jgi:hypothetical protein
MPGTHDDAGAMISQALSGLGQFASPVFLVLRRMRLADSGSLGYVRAHEQKGAL